MNRLLISFSIIPCLPIILFGLLFIFNSSSGLRNPLWAWSVLAVMFGIAGIVGLIMAGFKNTYHRKTSKRVSIALIACGYVAIGFGVAWAVTSYQIETQHVTAGGLSQPFPIVQYSIVVLFLLWPVCAGLVAINNLARANA